MSDIKLYYFDGVRGRAEISRLVMQAAGKKFEDVRIAQEEWPSMKPKTPYGSLPYLEYKGQTYGQSQAIAFFLAREFGLAGKTTADGCRVQEITLLVEDVIQSVGKSMFEPDADKKAELEKKFAEEDCPKFLGFFEKHIKSNGGTGFIVGANVTLADLAVFDISDTLLARDAKVLDNFPLIQKLRDAVEANANVKTYLASRKPSPF